MIAVPLEESASPTDKEVEIISAPLEKLPKTLPPTKPPSEEPKMPKATVEKEKEKAVEVGEDKMSHILVSALYVSKYLGPRLHLFPRDPG